MKKTYLSLFLILFSYLAVAQQYDNSEKLSVLVGFTSTGSEFVFWSDNVYGGNLQLVYDVKKIEEGAIALKGSVALANGYSGYYGGLNLRIGSRFFADMDLLFGLRLAYAGHFPFNSNGLNSGFILQLGFRIR